MTDVLMEPTEDTPLKQQPIVEDPDIFDDGKEYTDAASVLVIIFQAETTPCNKNINELKWAFSDPYFTVQVCSVDSPRRKVAPQSLENYNMRQVLTYASEGPYIVNPENEVTPQRWWHKLPCIIVRDNSISHLLPPTSLDGMKRRIKTALQRAKQVDLFFLGQWDGVTTTSTQAVMYTPSSRDLIRKSLMGSKLPLHDYLTLNIAKGRLLATVFTPNIIDVDTHLAVTEKEPATINQRALSPPPAVNTTPMTTTIVWLMVVIVLVVLIAWALVQLIPRTA